MIAGFRRPFQIVLVFRLYIYIMASSYAYFVTFIKHMSLVIFNVYLTTHILAGSH